MEVLPVYPWMVWLSRVQDWGKPPLSLFSALAIMGVTAYTAKKTLGKAYSLNRARLITLGVGIGLLIVLIRLEYSAGYALWDTSWQIPTSRLPMLLLAVGFGVYLMWRGVTLGREELRSDYLYRNFTVSTTVFIFLIVVWWATLRAPIHPPVFSSLSVYLLGYYFVALLAMGLSNYQERLGGAGASTLLTRRWLAILTAMVMVIVLIAGVVASNLSLNLVDTMLQSLGVLIGWLAIALAYIIAYPLGFIVTVIYYVISFLVSLVRSRQKPEPPERPFDLSDLPEKAKEAILQLPPGLVLALKWLLFIFIFSAIIYVLARLLFRYSKRPQDKDVSEIHSSLWSWAGFKADLKAFLRGLLARFRRKVMTYPAPVPPKSVTAEDAGQLLDVRELYRGLLWEGQQAGVPRRVGDTPYEYQQTLVGLKPVHEEVAAVTEAYVQERYGHIPVDTNRLAALFRIWLRLRSALRQPTSLD